MANSELTDGQIQAMLRRWFVEAEGAVKVKANVGVFRFCCKIVQYVLALSEKYDNMEGCGGS